MAVSVEISDKTFEVDSSLPHIEQVEEYRKALNALLKAESRLAKIKEEARAAGRKEEFFDADVELERISKYWFPFTAASTKAETLVEEGRRVNDLGGGLAPEKEGYDADPIITLFMIILEQVTEEFLKALERDLRELVEQDAELKDYIEAFVQLTPGLRILQDFRDQIIPADDTGEVAKLIRDPLKRPVEIIQNVRDKIIDPKDNGEIAKIIRDPIKRPVEVVKKIFKW